jgi:hypothetical protein
MAAHDYLRRYLEIVERASEAGPGAQSPPKIRATPGKLGVETRRSFLAMFAGATLWTQRPARAEPSPGQLTMTRHYRADAVITLLGVPVFSRQGVGGAFLSFDEKPSVGGRETEIRFAAGSLPERARGLNRFGFIQEQVSCRGRAPERAEYLGLMTENREDSLDDAKKSLTPAGGNVRFNAIHGCIESGRSRSRLTRIDLPGTLRWRDCAGLAGMLHAMFSGANSNGMRVQEQATDHAMTFLFTIVRAMESDQSRFEAPFLYSGADYQFRMSKQADLAMTKRLRERALAFGGDLMRMDGEMVKRSNRARTEFRLWYAPSARPRLPVRFEFKARSFLQLAFEQDLTEPEPARLAGTNAGA